MLVEIPSADEFADNIVVFWRPETPLAAGSEHALRLPPDLGPGPSEELPLAAVVATRSGLSILDARERVFVVDFDLGMIDFADRHPAARGQRRRGQGPEPRAAPRAATSPASASTSSPATLPDAEFRLWLDSDGDPRLRDLALPLEQVIAPARPGAVP